MRKTLSIFMLLFYLLTGCEMSNYKTNETPKSEGAVNNLLSQMARSFEKKYKMSTIATNVAMPRGVVKILGLDFQMLGPRSREDIREILINSVQDFLLFVNSNEEVRPYLENYPFEIKNVEITLFFINSKRMELNDPYIGIAGISEGKLDYQILIDTDGIPSIKNEYVESYDEALNALSKP